MSVPLALTIVWSNVMNASPTPTPLAGAVRLTEFGNPRMIASLTLTVTSLCPTVLRTRASMAAFGTAPMPMSVTLRAVMDPTAFGALRTEKA